MNHIDFEHFDIIIIGTGIGGSTLLSGLVDSGVKALVVEKGDFLKDCPEAKDAQSIFIDQFFHSNEKWLDANGNSFSPGNYYCVGGNSKFYGAVMLRYRQQDFAEIIYQEGVSPAWPFPYEELAPFYTKAETLYQVKGVVGEDPSEPKGERGYVGPAIPDEPAIADVRKRLTQIGAKPFSLPLAINIDRWLERSSIPWDAFPGIGAGKIDAEEASLKPSLLYANVTLITNAEVLRLNTDSSGKRIVSAELKYNGYSLTVSSDVFVLSAGAVNSAALLLKSANSKNPNGLANSSDQVGRNFMNHNCTALLALHPFRKNDSIYQKTLGINDYYLNDTGKTLGNIQLLGKIGGVLLNENLTGVPHFITNWVASHSIDWYVMSEDLPSPDSQVKLDPSGRIILDWKRSNMETHHKLLRKAKALMRKAGYPILLSRPFDRKTPSHQCGTICMGNDPKKSPLDPFCRSYDHKNLFVVDASFLPSSAAVNPALTIAAQALRVAQHIKNTEFHS